MGQGIIVAILSVLFYLTNLLGGNLAQPITPQSTFNQQQSYSVLGQTGQLLTDMTLRSAPQAEATPVISAQAKEIATILDKTDNWYKIRLNSGLEGWVPTYSLTIAPIQPKSAKRSVFGFYSGDEHSYESLLENSSQLTALAPLGWQLNSYGELVANFDPEHMGKSLYYAGNQELKTFAQLTVEQNPSRLLASTYLHKQSGEKIRQMLHDWGLSGVLINLDYLPDLEQEQLNEFLASLKSLLQSDKLSLALALPWNQNLDYAKLAHNVDYLVLKTTQQENTKPSPLQAVDLLADLLTTVTAQVDSTKIILALNTKGLDWPRSGLPQVLSHEQVLELAAAEGATVKWDSKQSAPYFHYGTGHEVWFENRYSVKAKIDLAKKYNLAGIALDNLGQEDPEIWPLIESYLVS